MKVKLLSITPNYQEIIEKAVETTGVELKDAIKTLVKGDYSSVLEHIYLTFLIEGISIAISRELLEHRIASHTGRSTRYIDERDFSYYIPEIFEKNKQLRKIYETWMKMTNEMYRSLRSIGVRKEEARYILPLATHCSYVWTVNVRSLINFLGLRLCVRSAPEMRKLARKIQRICQREIPEIFESIYCRGYNNGVCTEVKRPPNCPLIGIIPHRWENESH